MGDHATPPETTQRTPWVSWAGVSLATATLLLPVSVLHPMGMYEGTWHDLGVVQVGWWGMAHAVAAVLAVVSALLARRLAPLLVPLFAGPAAWLATLAPITDAQGPGLVMVAYPCTVLALLLSLATTLAMVVSES